jgi:hypothetical protein
VGEKIMIDIDELIENIFLGTQVTRIFYSEPHDVFSFDAHMREHCRPHESVNMQEVSEILESDPWCELRTLLWSAGGLFPVLTVRTSGKLPKNMTGKTFMRFCEKRFQDGVCDVQMHFMQGRVLVSLAQKFAKHLDAAVINGRVQKKQRKEGIRPAAVFPARKGEQGIITVFGSRPLPNSPFEAG